MRQPTARATVAQYLLNLKTPPEIKEQKQRALLGCLTYTQRLPEFKEVPEEEALQQQ
jgi:hypothetical protein